MPPPARQVPSPNPAPAPRVRESASKATRPSGGRLADAGLIVAFLGLVFLLGAFPQKDFDLWFHLRTGDLIRQIHEVPRHDIYTFTVPEHDYIDLHWGFEVVASWIFGRGGMRALNLAKCGVTCLALMLLITARRRDWPVWVMVLAWLPALFLLGGRMYVRPETLSLLFLAVFLAVLSRWDRHPWLAWALPVTQALWVNVQGLFVLGPIVLGMALADAALAPGAFAPGRRGWWRTVGLAGGATVLACLLNPYGIEGAIFPFQLTQTMGNPIFNRTIAELTPIPEFIRRHGLSSLPLKIHLVVLALGGLSFLIPIAWRLFAPEAPPKAKPRAKPEDGAGESKPKSPKKRKPADPDATWRLRPFRILLYLAFGALGLQATRNSHQFSAVVGAVTAWNFAEWAAAIRRRSAKASEKDRPTWGVAPRVLAFGAIAGAFAFVASGAFYALAGEGRTIGLGEEPLWYPHEAAKFAGRAGMPRRMLGYHIGYPALYEYYHGPDRKVFADPRLEVIGPELYEQYIELGKAIAERRTGWEQRLRELGNPAILMDNAGEPGMGASLLASPGWRLAWFDPVASVFIPEGSARFPAVDFLARHFRPDAADDPGGVKALTASANALWGFANILHGSGRVDLARRLVPLGMDHARRVLRADPGSATGWKLLGQLELARAPMPGREPDARFRKPLNPVLDLPALRASFALREALARDPDAPLPLYALADSFAARGMAEAALSLFDRLAGITPINPAQQTIRAVAEARRIELARRIGTQVSAPAGKIESASDLDAAVMALLDRGRAASAADLLEREAPSGPRPWAEADRLATLRLHLGEPDRARAAWQSASAPPQPALRTARLALADLVEGDFDAARRGYRDAVAADPSLFEAQYGLAVLEFDAGRAAEATAAADRAHALAPPGSGESASRALAEAARPFADGR